MELRPTLFWDTDPKKINLQKNAKYVIERVMEYGKDEEVRWIWSLYSKDLLREVAYKSRSLSPETKNLWQAILTEK